MKDRAIEAIEDTTQGVLDVPAFQRGPFYNVWYAKLNLKNSDGRPRALWIRYTTHNQDTNQDTNNVQRAEVWAVFFDGRPIGVKKDFGASVYTPLPNDGVMICGQYWDNDQRRTVGAVNNQGSQPAISWDLSFRAAGITGSVVAPFYHVPPLLAQFKINKTTVYTPHPYLVFNGNVTVDGVVYPVENAHGMQGRIFGTKNGHGWSWAHANQSDDGTPFVFEGLSAQIKLANRYIAPPISVFMIEIPEGRFEWTDTLSAFFSQNEAALESWHFRLKQRGFEFIGGITTPIDRFAGVTYSDTDGSKLYCHNSKTSSLKLEIYQQGVLLRTIRSTNLCAYEWVQRQQDRRVELVI
jgi:hypothetical protein